MTVHLVASPQIPTRDRREAQNLAPLKNLLWKGFRPHRDGAAAKGRSPFSTAARPSRKCFPVEMAFFSTAKICVWERLVYHVLCVLDCRNTIKIRGA